MSGEALFLSVALSSAPELAVEDLSLDDLTRLESYLKESAEDLHKGFAGLVNEVISGVCRKRVLRSAEVDDAEALALGEEALERSEGFDQALRGSGGGSEKCEVRSEKSHADEASNDGGEA